MMGWKRIRPHLLKVFLAIYLLLGVIYSISSPILEAPDEMWHYPYVRYVAEKRRLPPWDTGSLVSHESSQPPLYYAAAALATAWVDPSDLEALLQRSNPYWGYPAAGTVNDNKNLFLHTDAETFPWSGTALAVHVARLVNLIFGALTVTGVYLLVSDIFPQRSGLIASATALVAFNPQFLFISAAVNNDVAASAFSTVALWLLVRGLQRGYTLRLSVALGLVIGLAILSKVSALALLPLAALAMAFAGWRTRRWARVCRAGLIVLLVTAAVAGWWYARNAILYDDPFGVKTHFETWWAHEEPLSPAEMWARLPAVERSFWAAFGWGNVRLPMTFYVTLWILARLAVVGLALWVVQAWKSGRRPGTRAWSLALLALWSVTVFVALLRWMQLVEAALGRLLFPAVGAIAILLTWGLNQFASYILRFVFRIANAFNVSRVVPAGLAAALFCVAAASPFVAIKPAYAPPPLLSEEQIADRTAHNPTIRFGSQIRLVGYKLARRSVRPGEKIPITLCWKAEGKVREEYAYFVHFLGPEDAIVGARNTHPGLGRFPTSQWSPGDAFCDVLRVPVEKTAPTQAVYDVEIGWYHPETRRRLPAYSVHDTPIDLVVLDKIRVAPNKSTSTHIPNRMDVSLGDQIALLGYDLSQGKIHSSQAITVTLYWKAQNAIPNDYTVFVHLAAIDGPPFAQDDSPPRRGTYPTSFWAPGEVVTDTHFLRVPTDLPAGEYSLVTGMYLLETGERLPAFDPEGKRLPGDIIPLTTLEMNP